MELPSIVARQGGTFFVSLAGVTRRDAHVTFAFLARGWSGAFLQKLCSTPCSVANPKPQKGCWVAKPYALTGVLGFKTLDLKELFGLQNPKPQKECWVSKP